MEEYMFKSIISITAIGAALITAPVLAGTTTSAEEKSVTIQYADLNLNSAEGQERLEQRIDAAARKVCKLNEHRTGTRIPSQNRKECFVKARKSAQSQMASVIRDTRRGG